MIKIFSFFLLSLLIISCSLNKNSKIWNKKDIKVEENKDLKIVLDEKKISYSELNPNINLDLSNISVGGKILNNKNNYGAQKYSGNFKKIKKFKFSKFAFENQIDFQPIFLRDGIILFDAKGSIIRYDSNAKIVWKKNFYKKSEKKNNPRLFLAIKENRLIVIDSLSNLFLVNLENGNLIWSTKNEYPFNSEIKILNEKFFAVDIKNVLRCFYIKDGSECWSLETDKTLTLSNSKNSLIISNKLVVFVNNLGDVTAADIQSGAMVWQLPTQSSAIANSTYSFKNSKLVLDEDEIYFSNNFNEFHSINLNNGSINWINDISSSLTPIIVNSLIFTISENGYLFVIDKKTGNIIKIKDVFKNYKDKDKKKIKPMGFSISQDKVYLTNSDGKLIIIELSSGDIAKVENISRSLISKPFLFNNNLFVIKNGGIVKYE